MLLVALLPQRPKQYFWKKFPWYVGSFKAIRKISKNINFNLWDKQCTYFGFLSSGIQLLHFKTILMHIPKYIFKIYFSRRHYSFVNSSWICQDHHYIVLQHLSISFSQEMVNGWNIWCEAMPTAGLHCGKFQTHQNVPACNWKK